MGVTYLGAVFGFECAEWNNMFGLIHDPPVTAQVMVKDGIKGVGALSL